MIDMRIRELKNKPKMVETSVICDICGAECKNTNVEILMKFSFNDGLQHYKDLCYQCWEKKYKTKMLEQEQHDLGEVLKRK